MAFVGITGTHHVPHPDVYRWMDAWVERHGLPLFWVLGGARNVDTQAQLKCEAEGWDYCELFALWRWRGRHAGGLRNQDMVDVVATGGPGSAFLAFPCPLSRGTWDCVRRAQRAGLPVHVSRRLLAAA